jgi:RNA polymerase sigma-70 factor (ECF subfamily)
MSYLRTRPELLARFRKGDRAAQSEVYDAYLPQLHKLLGKGFVVPSSGLRVPKLESAQDRGDVIHEVFLRAFKEEARLAYDGQRDYGRYLGTIARNALVSHHRKHGRELPSSDRESYEDANVVDGESEGEPAHTTLDPKSEQLLQEFIATLSPRLRAFYKARYEDDLSQREIADLLSLSQTRVRQLEANLLRDVARFLKRAGFDPSGGTPSHG